MAAGRKIGPDAFNVYVSLGPGRSYQAVAKKYEVGVTAVAKRAKKENWQGRLQEIEAKAREKGDERAQETIEVMNEKHLTVLRMILGKSISALKNLSLESAIDCIRAIEMAIKQERLIRGEPSERAEVSLEEICKREYERWLKPTGKGDRNGHGD